MDEVKIKSSVTRRLLSEFLTRIINKKIGGGTSIVIKDLEINKEESATNKEYKFKVEVEGTITQTAMEYLLWKTRSGSGTN